MPRFLLLAGAIGLLVLLLLFFQATAGALVTSLSGAVARSDADLLVYQASARGNPAVSVLDAQVAELVAQVDGVAAAAPVGQSFAVATRGGEDEDAVIIGVDPDGPGLPASLRAGRLPAGTGEALFSASGFSAASRTWQLGDTVALQDADVRLTVVGLADDAAANASATLYVPLATYEELVRARMGTAAAQAPLPVSFVAVQVADGVEPDAVARRISAQVADVQALTRSEAVDALPGISTINRSFGILYVLLYAVVAIVTGVFFLILTVQKRDALVLLRAVGANRRDVVRLVLTQVVIVVGVGVLFGTGLAVGLLQAAREVFGATLAPSTAAMSALAVLVIGLLSSIGALRRITAIEPVEATRSAALT